MPRSLERGKLYQDRLYGAKVLSALAVATIDTPEFQRLEGLRQLGFANVVYRGAYHTRFEHSVGTYFVTRTLMRRIVQNHERLGLEHPGKEISSAFRHFPPNAGVSEKVTTYQSCWRGLTEVISAAALLHDLGHAPFGHTLEDEFTGLYPRHDTLGSARLYHMLFDDESSDLAEVFSDSSERWLGKLTNSDLRQLIYVILSWKEDIRDLKSPKDFETLLDQELTKPHDDRYRGRLVNLKQWHARFVEERMFHPFMSDIIGNTICADLLDYLPRDRQNLGVESKFHSRLQRYFTIRPGNFYSGEGLRLSIMALRVGRGGQRRDVATEILAIMRERYEMAERVFYHHKKAAASSMLFKLIEMTPPAQRPRDDEAVYPAPWAVDNERPIVPPHLTHLSDASLIDYLAGVRLEGPNNRLQRQLAVALRYRRAGLYRTLLVIDTDLAREGCGVTFIATELRGEKETPTSEGRLRLECKLVEAIKVVDPSADPADGEILLYCPSPDMQSKEVDVRVEIKPDGVRPLREQREAFTYWADVDVLRGYYGELWRTYLFVSPRIFKDGRKCKVILDAVCDHYHMPRELAYQKVRGHSFSVAATEIATRTVSELRRFSVNLPFETPRSVSDRFLSMAETDHVFLGTVDGGTDGAPRLMQLFEVAAVGARTDAAGEPAFTKDQRAALENHCAELLAGAKPPRISAFTPSGKQSRDFDAYVDEVITLAVSRLPSLGEQGE